MFPALLTTDANKPLKFTSKISSLNFTKPSDVIENYYNYDLVVEFDSLFLVYAGYFEIAGYNKDYNPLPLNEYLISSEANKFNHGILEKRLIKLLNLSSNTRGL